MSFSYDFTYEYYPLFVSPAITPSDVILNNNIDVTVYPTWFVSTNISWSYPAAWGAVTSNVYHAPTESGPFTKLNSTPLNSNINSLTDTTVQDFSKIKEGFYIVEATTKIGKRIQSSPTTWRNKRSSNIEVRANEISRRELLLLTNFTGIISYVFNRKTYGQRCPNCWSYTYEKVVKDKCTFCFGTSFNGGYWNPVKTFIQYESTPNQVELTYFGKWELNEMPAWTIAFPDIDQRDLIYRASDGKMFEVSDKKQTELQTVPMRQIFKVTELSKDNIAYTLATDNELIPL